jgi:hypothetical protein
MIPWPFDLLHNPQARADWERRRPDKAEEMRRRFPLRPIDDQTSKQEGKDDDR